MSSTPNKPNKTLSKLIENNIQTIEDLVWILPLRVIFIPPVKSFQSLKEGSYFRGNGKLISYDLTPAYGKKGKNRTQLFNVKAVVKDSLSNSYLNLKWFNAYPNIKKQLESLNEFEFAGVVQDFNSTNQIINPSITSSTTSSPKTRNVKGVSGVIVEYTTLFSLSGNQIRKLIQKIPQSLWETELHYFDKSLSMRIGMKPINDILKSIHGIQVNLDSQSYEKAKQELIYFEFLKEKLKVTARKLSFKKIKCSPLFFKEQEIKELKRNFKYEFTDDQSKVTKEILNDLESGIPMMRLVQGDVGCGKTTIAILFSALIINRGGQVAIMCPTEALARQHFHTLNDYFNATDTNIDLLIGSFKKSQRAEVLKKLSAGLTQVIVGTHSLFQKNVIFKDLKFCIIDEQHKFGVEQRVSLLDKGLNPHCLLMSATPIPRTLQLALYGDLDVSTIRTIPEGRKGIKTRIIRKDTFQKYLSFIKTRIELKEQIYVVVPSISESAIVEMKNIEQTHLEFEKFFPKETVSCIHGQLDSETKTERLLAFSKGQIDILISTSVIEVGINVLNATVMTIFDPDRFGLSSLHQLRGRVGRGSKPGFCFLIPDFEKDSKYLSKSLKRLQILEKSHDGFEVAEADLKNRGHGDIFGTHQSGQASPYKYASIIEHFDIFEKVYSDVEKLYANTPELFTPLIDKLIDDKKISTTI